MFIALILRREYLCCLGWIKSLRKIYKDSHLTLLLNRVETSNLSWCFPQHVSVGTCPLRTQIAGRPSALAGDEEVNHYTPSFSLMKSASGSCAKAMAVQSMLSS